ncbi:MAG TPA: hypothetical protein VJ860_13515 [Polyangia bacterium]|nr:hypothetical protein [Polyangia bacterium]
MSISVRRPTVPCLGLIAVLLVSLAVRLVLVLRGGQGFWPDEVRYTDVVAELSKWEAGHRREALQLLIGSADHLGFKVLMLAPAWLQTQLKAGIWFPSAIISLFSVANIFWIWRIARGMGADQREAFWAAATMACSNTMFYWTRHLVPYDVSLFWVLACASIALRPAPRVWDSLLAGCLGFLAAITYNGYWASVACVLTAHVLHAWPDTWAVAKRAGLGLLALSGSFLLLLLVARYLGISLLHAYSGFAAMITQGDFNEGYLVFFDYLWRAERFMALIWLGSLLTFCWLVRSCPMEGRRRGLTWATMVVALVAILIVGSNVLGKFVVYGRLARQVAPFCALLVGWTAARLFGPGGSRRRMELAALIVIFAAGAWSMGTPLRMEFPVAFHKRASVAMTAYQEQHVAAEPTAVANAKFRFLCNNFIWPYPAEGPLPRNYLVLLASPHPFSWRPYLYEGFNRAQRNKMEATDISMRLVLLQD